MSDSTGQLPALPAVVRWALGGALRHALVGLGATLLAAHVLPSQTAAEQFVNWGVNGAFIIGGLAWSYMNEKSKSSSTKTS